MRFGESIIAMGRLYFLTVVRSKRSLIAGVLFGIMLVLYVIGAVHAQGDQQSRLELYIGFLFLAPLGLLVQFGALFYGLAVFSEEIDNGTIIYLFVRPISRVAIFGGRFLAAFVTVGGMLSLMSLTALLIAMPDGAVKLFFWAEVPILLGTACYLALFCVIASLFKNPFAPSLFFIVAWEMVVSALKFPIHSGSIKYHLLVLLDQVVPENMHHSGDLGSFFETYSQGEPGKSLLVLGAVTVVGLLVAVSQFRQYQVYSSGR